MVKRKIGLLQIATLLGLTIRQMLASTEHHPQAWGRNQDPELLRWAGPFPGAHIENGNPKILLFSMLASSHFCPLSKNRNSSSR